MSVTPSKQMTAGGAVRTTEGSFAETMLSSPCEAIGRCILELMAAVATALLLALIARDGIGMPPDMVREDALIAASIWSRSSPASLRASRNRTLNASAAQVPCVKTLCGIRD